ncbi:MAG: hypothetical protein ACRDL2_11800 [Gaiellaceae bacterium]
MGGRRGATIVIAGERLRLGPDQALRLADHLWTGSRPGAVTAAGKLAGALDAKRSGAIEFAPYEVDAVRDGLAVLGLS